MAGWPVMLKVELEGEDKVLRKRRFVQGEDEPMFIVWCTGWGGAFTRKAGFLTPDPLGGGEESFPESSFSSSPYATRFVPFVFLEQLPLGWFLGLGRGREGWLDEVKPSARRPLMTGPGMGRGAWFAGQGGDTSSGGELDLGFLLLEVLCYEA